MTKRKGHPTAGCPSRDLMEVGQVDLDPTFWSLLGDCPYSHASRPCLTPLSNITLDMDTSFLWLLFNPKVPHLVFKARYFYAV